LKILFCSFRKNERERDFGDFFENKIFGIFSSFNKIPSENVLFEKILKFPEEILVMLLKNSFQVFFFDFMKTIFNPRKLKKNILYKFEEIKGIPRL